MRIAWCGLAALLAISGTAEAAPAWGVLAGYVDWASDYRFYGLSESNRQPAMQGGLHWLAPENFYAGVFVSQVRFKDYRGTSVETDFYAGRHFLFDGNDLNAELLYAVYPDTAGHPSYAPAGVIYPTYNFIELTGELKHDFDAFTLGAKVLWEPSLERRKPEIHSLNASGSYRIADWLKLETDAGHQWSTLQPERSYWDVGLVFSRGWQWAFDLRYYGSDAGRRTCFGMNWCGSTVVAKLTYTFQVL